MPVVALRRSPAPRRGFTLVELLVGLGVAGVVIAALAIGVSSLFATADSQVDRTGVAQARLRLDARLGEIAAATPAYGDLLVLANNALSYRKRHAPTATVCAFDGTTVTLRLRRSELDGLRVGDSVAVLRMSSTPSAPVFAAARITSVVAGSACAPLPAGAVSLAVALPAALPDTEIARGATTRVWSVRAYTVEADPSAPGQYQLTERVNGGDPAKLMGPFSNPSVFTYWQDWDGTVPAAGALSVALVRATFTPVVATSTRARATTRAEVLSWPVRSLGLPQAVRGDINPTIITGTAVPGCTTPGAANYGDPVHACTFAAPTAVIAATPNPATDLDNVQVSGTGSFSPGGATITTYDWRINGAAGWSGGAFTLRFGEGTNTLQLRVQDSRGTWSAWVTAYLTVSGSCTPQPSQGRTIACPSGQTGSIEQQRDWNCATGAYGGWYETWNTCQVCNPQPSQTQTLGCPAGQTGEILQQRDWDCASSSYGGWYVASQTCTDVCNPQPSQTQTVAAACPAGQTGTVVQQRDWSCAAGGYGPWYDTGAAQCSTVDCGPGQVSVNGTCVAACPFAGQEGMPATSSSCFQSYCSADIRYGEPGLGGWYVAETHYQSDVKMYGDGRQEVSPWSLVGKFMCMGGASPSPECYWEGGPACSGQAVRVKR